MTKLKTGLESDIKKVQIPKNIKLSIWLIVGVVKSTERLYKHIDQLGAFEASTFAVDEVPYLLITQIACLALWKALEAAYCNSHLISDIKKWRNCVGFNNPWKKFQRYCKLYALRKQRFVEKNKGLTHIV